MKPCRIALLLAASVSLAACSEWQYDVTVRGATFSRVKVDTEGKAIGVLKAPAEIAGRYCDRGWVHVHPNGVPAAFTAAEPIALSSGKVPRATWVRQDENGVILSCAFPHNLEVQGHRVRGTGGPKGVMTAFHASGALKQFFPVGAAVIDGVACRAGLVGGWIELHENGRLKSCLLGAALERDGRSYRPGTRVEFAPDGRIVAELRAAPTQAGN